MKGMNILVTLDTNYIHHLTVMLKSLAMNNRQEKDITVYIMSRDLTGRHVEEIRRQLREPRVQFVLCSMDPSFVQDAPTSKRYPLAIYDRLFAARYLPDSLDRILYLDPDLIVLKSLEELWNIPMDDNLYAAASHVGIIGDLFNSVRVGAEDVVRYYNSGVLLMNLQALREELDINRIINYIQAFGNSLLLPDQDILTGLYGKRILALNPYLYNMTERLLIRSAATQGSGVDLQWVCDHSCIVHYVGRNKPWKPGYRGKLGNLYGWYESMLDNNVQE